MVTQEFFQVYLDNLSLAFSTVFISNFPTCLHIFKPTNIPPPSAETFYSTSQIIGEASEGNPSTSASAPRLSLDSERRVFPPVSGKALQPVLLIPFLPTSSGICSFLPPTVFLLSSAHIGMCSDLPSLGKQNEVPQLNSPLTRDLNYFGARILEKVALAISPSSFPFPPYRLSASPTS